jgi:hypothetical protein
MNALKTISNEARCILQQLHDGGALSVSTVKSAKLAQTCEDRVIYRPHETVHETVRAHIEIYTFE